MKLTPLTPAEPETCITAIAAAIVRREVAVRELEADFFRELVRANRWRNVRDLADEVPTVAGGGK